MFKRMFAVLLAACFILGMAACGEASAPGESSYASADSQGQSTEPDSPAEMSASEREDYAGALAEPSENPDSAKEPETEIEAEWTPLLGTVDYDLPLFDDTFEVSMFWVLLGGNFPENDDRLFWQRYQEALNVDIDFVMVSEMSINERYNLMLSSGDMTELIWESNCGAWYSTATYSAGYDAAIADELYMDLTDLIPENCPNYNALLDYYPEVRRALTTDSGKLYSLSMIYNRPNGPRGGTVIRKDYLEATGMDAPETTSELFDVAMAMKENGVQYPIGILAAGDMLGDPVFDAFGTTNTSSFKVELETDTLVYDGTSDELRAYIEYFRQLWENALVSPDFLNVTIFDSTMQTDGTNGIWGMGANNIPAYVSRYGIETFPIPKIYRDGNPQKEYTLTSYEYMIQQTSAKKNVVLTTACRDPEKSLQMLDWLYSADGIRATNYGWVEGESYQVVDGECRLLDFMSGRNEDNVPYEILYLLDEGPMLNITEKMNGTYTEEVLAAKDGWMNVDLSKVSYTTMPSVFLTQEESEATSQIATDISSFLQTQVLKWMTCQEELTDASWKQYCDTIVKMGLSDLTKVYEEAYERFKNR